MQDDTALYGAKMMQPVMTPADSEENNLRPQHLEDYIGQEKVKQNLKIYLEANAAGITISNVTDRKFTGIQPRA